MDDSQELEYSPDWIHIRSKVLLQMVDRILLAEMGRTWERVRDLLPSNKKRSNQDWPSSSPEELRTSRLGQALLTIADCADGNFIEAEKVHRAIKRACRMLYGDPQGEGYTLPPDFHKTELGQLVHSAYFQMYESKDLLTAKQAYTLLGIARQTLYERRDRGKLTGVYLSGGELRFVRAEIEAWKTERNKRQHAQTEEE